MSVQPARALPKLEACMLWPLLQHHQDALDRLVEIVGLNILGALDAADRIEKVAAEDRSAGFGSGVPPPQPSEGKKILHGLLGADASDVGKAISGPNVPAGP